MVYDLGIDLGTTGLKAVIADAGGRIAGIGYREYPLNSPAPNYAEQDPEAWYRAMCLAIGDALGKAALRPSDVRCVGFSGQMHGLVLLDGDGEVLCPAIIHCDGRAAKQKQEIISRVGVEKLGRWVQNQVHSGFQSLSLMWVKENRPEIYERARHALLPKDYLRYRLCGEFGTEPTDACSTLMFDNVRMRWSDDLIHELGIDKSLLPDCRHHPYEIAGRVTRRAAAETGLAEGTLVSFGGGDQPMQAVGNGLLLPGSSCVNLGTSGQVFVAADRPLYDPLLRTHTFCHAPADSWYVMGAVLNACLAANWFNGSVCASNDYRSMHDGAAQVAPGCNGLIFLPYLTGERTPHMNENARGAFIGLTLRHDRNAMARAVLEGVAYSLKDCLEIVRGLGLPVAHTLLSGGGARSALWRQIVADVFEIPMYLAETGEQAAMGAVLCAQVAAGEYRDLAEACGTVVKYNPTPTEPNPANFSAYRENYALFREAYPANVGLFRGMSGR